MSMNFTPLLFLPREYLLWKLLVVSYKLLTVKLYEPDESLFDS